MKVNRDSAPHYSWGAQCDGWILSADNQLSVIEERMPPTTSEVRHYHETARQFFYVLSGALTIEVEGQDHDLSPGDGIAVAPMQKHRVYNPGPLDARFLVTSTPSTRGDRVDQP